jgi:hypothetical protein
MAAGSSPQFIVCLVCLQVKEERDSLLISTDACIYQGCEHEARPGRGRNYCPDRESSSLYTLNIHIMILADAS